MATTNITATIVPYKYIPIMLEADWELICINPNSNAFRSQGDGSAVLLKQGDWPTRSKDGLQKGLLQKRGEEEGDATIPSATAAIILNAGDIIRLTCDEPMSIGPSGSRGFLLVTSGNPVKIKFQKFQESNPNVIVYETNRPILKSETGCLLSYVQPGGGIQDLDGNDLASFTNLPVTNSSNNV